MMNNGVKFLLVTLYVLLAVQWPGLEAHRYHPGSQVQGRKPSTGKSMEAKKYLINSSSPPVTGHTKASLTLNSFEKGGGGGGPSECDGHYHPDSQRIVALSTGWYNHGRRCGHFITINGNGRTVKAKVVDECDSNGGCRDNIVDASRAVWEALGVSKGSEKYGLMDVTWSD